MNYKTIDMRKETFTNIIICDIILSILLIQVKFEIECLLVQEFSNFI